MQRLAKQHIVTNSVHIGTEITDPIEGNWLRFKEDLLRMAYMDESSLADINFYVLNSVDSLDPPVRPIIMRAVVCANCVNFRE